MTSIVPVHPEGDWKSGAADAEELQRPWGYYAFLGVPTDATHERIEQAYRRLAKKLHPDRKGGDSSRFSMLQTVADTLLDEEPYGERRQYDLRSSLDEYFDGFLEAGGERTSRISEMIVENFQRQRPADIEQEDAAEEPMDVIEEYQRQLYEQATHEASRFFRSFASDPQGHQYKILDALYEGSGRVVIGPSALKNAAVFTRLHEGEHMIRMSIGGDAHVAGWKQMHFKAENGRVIVADTALRGIVHVVSGSITVYDGPASKGRVIRAKAPMIYAPEDEFAERAGCYVQKEFAKGRWWRKHSLDLAVKDGKIAIESPKTSIYSHSGLRGYGPAGF
ncbi:MAG: J domain-containing protein [Candidatus Aenigmarchaeota archaeon]|nr:J domain-containing protein [Candidatus Aenigmarchaeota archaeon]